MSQTCKNDPGPPLALRKGVGGQDIIPLLISFSPPGFISLLVSQSGQGPSNLRLMEQGAIYK